MPRKEPAGRDFILIESLLVGAKRTASFHLIWTNLRAALFLGRSRWVQTLNMLRSLTNAWSHVEIIFIVLGLPYYSLFGLVARLYLLLSILLFISMNHYPMS